MVPAATEPYIVTQSSFSQSALNLLPHLSRELPSPNFLFDNLSGRRFSSLQFPVTAAGHLDAQMPL